MKALVLGGGKMGAGVVKQIKKNPAFEVVVAGWRDESVVCKDIPEKSFLKVHVTPMNIREVVASVRPDVVFVARSASDWMHGGTSMGSQYVKGMERQLLDASVPVIIVSEDMGL